MFTRDAYLCYLIRLFVVKRSPLRTNWWQRCQNPFPHLLPIPPLHAYSTQTLNHLWVPRYTHCQTPTPTTCTPQQHDSTRPNKPNRRSCSSHVTIWRWPEGVDAGSPNVPSIGTHREAVLYLLLETDLRLHVDSQLDADTPNVEATFEAIGMAFEAVQPIIGNDHSGCPSFLLT